MWELDDQLAAFVAAPFRIEIDTARPARGIQRTCVGDHELTIRPLQISATPPLQNDDEPIEERYVRGNDLITTYKLANNRTARSQFVWTCSVDDGTLTLDTTIGMQTPLLASDPSLTSTTTFPAAQALVAVASGNRFEFHDAEDDETADVMDQACGLFLFRLPGECYSYAEMVFPADFDARRAKLSDGLLEYRLICEHLEKGVIRKAQLRSMLIPRDSDTELAMSGFLNLGSAAPPLAT